MPIRWSRRIATLSMLLVVLMGLGGSASARWADDQSIEVPLVGPAIPRPAPPTPRVVFLGDSITFGSFTGREHAFPAVLGQRLAEEGHPIRVVNAGVHGNTAESGMNRLYALAKAPIDVLVLELGGNDGLRGDPLEGVESSLRLMIHAAASEHVPVLLLGMRIPDTLDADYARDFAALYDRIASEEEGVSYVPFFMEQAVARQDTMFPDGIHPTALGHQLIAEDVLPVLQALVESWEQEAGRDDVSDDCVALADLRHFAASLEEEALEDPVAREQLLTVFAQTTGFRKEWRAVLDKGGTVALDAGTVTIENRATLALVVFDRGVYPMREAPCGNGESFLALVGLGEGRMAVLRWPSRTWSTWGVSKVDER